MMLAVTVPCVVRGLPPVTFHTRNNPAGRRRLARELCATRAFYRTPGGRRILARIRVLEGLS